jgi:hypothetical protein
MVGTWIVRDLYEVIPDDYSAEVTQSFAWMQTFRAIGLFKITGVAWYRSSTDHDPPVSLSIWERFTQSRPWQTFDVPDSGSVGWQEVDLTDTPVYLEMDANRIVGAGAYSNIGGLFSAADQSASFIGGVPANIPLQSAYSRSNAGNTFPDSVATSRVYGLDLRMEPASPVPNVSSDVDTSLASYLTTAGANYDGSPLADIKTTVQNTFNDVEDASTGLAAIKADTQSLLDRLTEAWRDTVASNTDGIPGFLTAWDAFYTQFVALTAGPVADLVEAVGDFTGISVLGYLAELIRWANGINAPPQLAEGDDWELLDETDFTNNLLWPVEADVYRVTLASFDPAGTSEPVGTETRHAYLGKWCPFNVQFSSEWHYFNTKSADLYLGGRMPGLGLILYRRGTGHVQAWRRTEAP